MSMALGFSERDKTRRRSCHRRNDSGELDVFDAEGYFSSINDKLEHGRTTTLYQELGLAIRDDHYGTSTTRQGISQGRVSLDIPMSHHHHYHHHNHQQQHQNATGSQLENTNPVGAKEKKHRQPSSPGGKLASFFTSLMQKKKSSKSSAQSVNKDGTVEEESPSSWRRRRRSSISHFRSSNSSSTRTRTFTSDSDTKSIHSYVINTPIKSFKEFSSFSDQRKPMSSLSSYKNNTTAKPSSATQSSTSANLEWLDEKIKCINGSDSDKQVQVQVQPKILDRYRVDRNSSEEMSRELKRSFIEDDGAESDSSSDLFELQLNYDHHHLGYCSSGLPVYETTRMDTIKRSTGTPITNI